MNKELMNSVLNFEGVSVGNVNLDPSIFSVKVNQVVLYEVIRWHMSKNRQGTHSTKGVSEVSGSTKKCRPQKESGKARQGDGREPHFRGGGVSFGPKPRSYEFDLNKKVKKLAVKMSISKKMNEESILFVDDLANHSSNKTSDFSKMLENILKDSAKKVFKDKDKKILKDQSKIKVLFIANTFQESFERGASNLHNVNLLKLAGLNSLSILKHDIVVFDKNVLEDMEGRLK
ncbi:50S ribosomal protein L4 [Candidatus Cytomitobacter primus]|uniref:Large ribosomal subunit protein uL4 n=1 Tax=Candidatus Cytomitobacter primus TaxID=2066024 RepID=A0A5C0UG85_9PROT|nr:50S ribosomal protein L4 [Candidatus Cytomitobacter primus]QEK38740.1 50S ribosomal protein L4 [Candidatus Cytomitobacter primus]